MDVFDALTRDGHDEDFVENTDGWVPTVALPGSQAKVRVLAERVRRGHPLWHPQDCTAFERYHGAVPTCSTKGESVKAASKLVMRRTGAGGAG